MRFKATDFPVIDLSLTNPAMVDQLTKALDHLAMTWTEESASIDTDCRKDVYICFAIGYAHTDNKRNSMGSDNPAYPCVELIEKALYPNASLTTWWDRKHSRYIPSENFQQFRRQWLHRMIKQIKAHHAIA